MEARRQTGARIAPSRVDQPGGSVMQTVSRVCNVLLAFTPDEPTLGVSEIARRLALPKSVVHRTLDSLVQMGFVMRERTSSRYRLGPRAVDIGFAALAVPDIRGLALPVLEDLVRHSRETATLSLLAGHQRFYAAQVEGPQEIRMSVEIGRRCPLYAGASGRAILAFFSQAQLEAYLRSTDLKQLTSTTVTDRERLSEQLACVREQGYAVSYGERDAWAAAVAAPLVLGGAVLGSISVCGPLNRFRAETAQELGPKVREHARQLSERLA